MHESPFERQKIPPYAPKQNSLILPETLAIGVH